MFKRKKILLFGVLFFCGLWTANDVNALEMKAFSWREDFEDVCDPVQFLAERNKTPITVNYKGVTTEKAFSGKHSFKLDVTFGNDGAAYWAIPVNIPAEGKLKMTARIYIGEETHAPGKSHKFMLGADCRYEPISYRDSLPTMVGVPNKPSSFAPEYYMCSGARSFPAFREMHKGKWLEVEADLTETSRSMVSEWMEWTVWRINPEDIAKYVDRIGIYMFRMQTGGRLVVYIDDIKIEGEIPDEQAYKQEMTKRWLSVKRQTEEKLMQWEQKFKKINGEIKSLTDLPPTGQLKKEELVRRISGVYEPVEFREMHNNGYIRTAFYDNVENFLAVVDDYIRNIERLKVNGEPAGVLDFYSVPTSIMPVQRILPDDILISGKIMHNPEVTVTLCPGEYEPASFVIKPKQDVKGVQLEVSDLKGEKDVLSGSCVDIRTVKAWYQNEGGKRIMMPELLLYDDSMVQVDEKKQENRVKLRFSEGDKYICFKEPMPEPRKRNTYPNSQYPIQDTKTLQPVDVEANKNKQFWITVHLPEETKGGVYKGNIKIIAGGKTLSSIALTVNVLPVKLLPPPFYTSIYGGGYLEEGEGTVVRYKDELQYRNELKNLVSHGIVNPTFSFSRHYTAEQRLKLFAIRREVGVDDTKVLFTGEDPDRFIYIAASQGKLPDGWQEKAKESVAAVIAEARAQGVEEVYFYGMDEARGDRLSVQRPVWETIRSLGGKIYCTGGSKGSDGNLALMGDIQDLYISYGKPTREEAEQWHSRGHKIGSCWNSGGRYIKSLGQGVEDPDAHRRLNGLMLWKNNYDLMTYYTYYELFPWNNAAAIAYPTIDGVIDTMQWEALREGIDDARYAATLEQAIRRTKNGADETKKAVAVEAEKYLEEMDIEFGDLDAIRSRIIEYILLLQ